MPPDYDCVIVGAGPAGLTAAVYLGRYLRRAAVLDGGPSRALLIPKSHNYPGEKISGVALLARLREQALEYGAEIFEAKATKLTRGPGNVIVAHTSAGKMSSRQLILATGIVDRVPELPGLKTAISSSRIRFCPICDAYEARDKRIAVMGAYVGAAGKALFLRTFSRHITLLHAEGKEDERLAKELSDLGVKIVASRAVRIEEGENVSVVFEDGSRLSFDVLYPAFGVELCSELWEELGPDCNEEGCLRVDHHQHTNIQGVYAAGDVVSDLHQISVAVGHAAVAATAIHRSLPRNPREPGRLERRRPS